MRTIFITPLLWKKLDRAALRRGEEGQALVLVALVALGLVAMVGLSVDGGIAYLASTQLQRAADAAALAGVQWIPNNPTVADARAALSAESNGVRVACYYDTGLSAGSEYNSRCHRASVDQVNGSSSSQDLYSMTSSSPIGTGIRYSVTLTKKQQRLFLAFLGIFQKGFDEFTISRSSTAQFSQLVRFGASFNYFGSNGVLQDHYMRCGTASLADCAGSGSDLTMRGATYQKYVVMRCNQNPAPSPCVGGFWGHIAGQDLLHSSGDAYTPIRDGGAPAGGGCGIDNTCVSTDGSYSKGCLNTSDPSSWFVTQVYNDPNNGSCSSVNGGYPVQNQDVHPDSPGGQKGFGYEIGVQVDPNAAYSYAETGANLANHTNLNITIFDAGMNDMGQAEKAVGDNYQNQGSAYASFPAGSWSEHRNKPSDNGQWETRRLLCSPGTGTNCTTPAINSGQYPTASRPVTATSSVKEPDITKNLFRLVPDQNNVQLTYNDMRTRFTLYGPPVNDSIPSTFQNVSGNRIDSFEATDTSIRKTDPAYAYPLDVISTKYCYFIFDDQKQYWNNTRDLSTNSASSTRVANGGTGPDFAPLGSATTNRYSFVCPDKLQGENINPATADYRWNVLQGTPTARYGAVFNDPTRTIETNILPADSGTSSDIATSPIVTATLGASIKTKSGATPANDVYQTVQTNQTDPQLAGVPSIWTPTVTTSAGGLTYTGMVEPSQNCRQSAQDTDGWPVDSQWGHNRIPFNLAYGDPLVDRAWVTNTTQLKTNPVANKALAGYYTLEYGFHGWRCDWDFDSNYVNNPLKDPTQPHSTTNPSLSEQENSGQVGKYNKAFAEGHPGLTSNGYMAQLLGSDNASGAEICRDMLPSGATYASNCSIQGVNSAFGDKEFGLEPYFHLSNIAWVNGTIGLNTNPLTQVRAGTYMVHVQTFGGSGANRYSLKAEYENPKIFRPTNLDGTTFAGLLTPVPNVFALTAMGIYANNQVQSNQPDQNVVFDLANIPPDNAGTLAIVELWDAGDVSGNLQIEVRQPSGWGPRINTNNSSTPSSWCVPWPGQCGGGLNSPLTTKLQVCPYAFNPSASQLSRGCTFDTSSGRTAWTATNNGAGYYNDEWMLMSFSIPNAGAYAQWKQACATHNVPENLCYYFQINYHLVGSGATANDTTTWQLVVQGQPIHLVPNA